MGGTITVRCEKCNEKMDWDPLSDPDVEKVCDDCLEPSWEPDYKGILESRRERKEQDQVIRDKHPNLLLERKKK